MTSQECEVECRTIDIGIKKLRSDAQIPQYKSKGAAGFDLHAAMDKPISIAHGETIAVPLGFAVEIPRGWEIGIRSRSSFAIKGCFVTNAPGTIDSDYRGEVKVILTYISKTRFPATFTINPGERIAQGVLQPAYVARFNLKEELSNTERGEGGFGSTGK
jgi:dUTP pyrophosphatase